jgi:hypothetical protein
MKVMIAYRLPIEIEDALSNWFIVDFEEVILGFKNLACHKVGLKLPPRKSEDCAVFKIEENGVLERE